MKPIAELATLGTVFLLFTPASEGVKCYDCQSSKEVSSRSARLTNQNDTSMGRKTHLYDDPNCATRPSYTTSCEHGCFKSVQRYEGKDYYVRGCRDSKRQSKGCRSIEDGQECYCTKELCNRSHLLSCAWIVVGVSLVASVSFHHFLSYHFSH